MTEKEVKKFIDFCNKDFGKKLMDREAKRVREKLRGCDTVLSVGCGIGSIGERIGDLDIIYLDSSFQMLLEAKNRVEGPLVLASAERLPFKEKSLDCAYSITALEFIEDSERAVQEMARVLVPGGKLLAMMLNPESEYFKSHIKKEGSYFRKVQSEPKAIEKHMKKYFSTESEYFLGIKGKKVFDSNDPDLASLYVVTGIKKVPSK